MAINTTVPTWVLQLTLYNADTGVIYQQATSDPFMIRSGASRLRPFRFYKNAFSFSHLSCGFRVLPSAIITAISL